MAAAPSNAVMLVHHRLMVGDIDLNVLTEAQHAIAIAKEMNAQ